MVKDVKLSFSKVPFWLILTVDLQKVVTFISSFTE